MAAILPILGLVLLLLLYVGVPLLVAVWIFRAGAKERYLGSFPVFKALFYTFGVLLISVAVDWFKGEFDPGILPGQLAIAGTLLPLGSGIWLAGFFFSRWRASKSEGIVIRR